MTQMQWTPLISLPVNLTVQLGAGVLLAADPGPWCQRKSAELLGPGAGRKQTARLAGYLLEYAEFCRSGYRPAYAAMFFYPDFSRLPPRAMSEIYLLGEDSEAGPMTLARGRAAYGPLAGGGARSSRS